MYLSLPDGLITEATSWLCPWGRLRILKCENWAIYSDFLVTGLVTVHGCSAFFPFT